MPVTFARWPERLAMNSASRSPRLGWTAERWVSPRPEVQVMTPPTGIEKHAIPLDGGVTRGSS